MLATMAFIAAEPTIKVNPVRWWGCRNKYEDKASNALFFQDELLTENFQNSLLHFSSYTLRGSDRSGRAGLNCARPDRLSGEKVVEQ